MHDLEEGFGYDRGDYGSPREDTYGGGYRRGRYEQMPGGYKKRTAGDYQEPPSRAYEATSYGGGTGAKGGYNGGDYGGGGSEYENGGGYSEKISGGYIPKAHR